MAQKKDKPIDPDDLFAETGMSFGDHLEELRHYLWRAVIGFIIAMLVSLLIGKPVLYVFIIRPVEKQLQDFYDDLAQERKKEVLGDETVKKLDAAQPQAVEIEFVRSQVKALLEGRPVELVEKPEDLPTTERVRMQVVIPEPVKYAAATLDAQRLLGPRPTVKTFNVTEAFIVYFKISMITGFVLGSPWIFLQIWSFIAAGLYPHEKRYVHVYLPFSLGLFIAGVLACQFIVLPKAIGALLWFNKFLNLEPDLRLNEWIGFAIWFPILFGLSFQTPLVMLFLERLGLCTVETYRSKRRIAFFVLAIVAAFGPTVDAFSMLFQWIALCLLYQLGIWLCMWSPRKPQFDIDVPDREEMVEV